MSGTITAHKALPNVVVKGYANDDLIGSDSIGDMEADESEDFSISGSYTGSAVGLLCRAEVTVTFPPDLVIESFAISYDILAPGESFTLIAYVGNKGDIASGGTTLRWYQSTDETITSSDTELGTEAVGGLLGSQTVWREIDLTAPASAGTYYYGACVDAVSDESNTGNNCRATTLTFTDPPDLVVDSPTVDPNSPETAAPGETLKLTATARNQGEGASGSTRLVAYRSTDETITTTDTPVGTENIGGLAASETITKVIWVTAPSTAGTYYYGVCVAAVSNESDTGNNCSSAVTVTVVPTAPDLVVGSPTASDNSPAAGASFTLRRDGAQPGEWRLGIDHAALLPLDRREHQQL